jgi:hypothetical protein
MKHLLLIASFFIHCHLFAQSASLPVEGSASGLYVRHKVVQGQQFLSLARLYNLSPNAIAAFNGLKLSANLSAIVELFFGQNVFSI